MTLIWFVIWLVSSLIWDSEPLLFDPVNWWTGTLLFAIALDLASLHAAPAGRVKKAAKGG